MNFSELVLTRRTVHNYQKDRVSDALVEEALQLSVWAPNHKLSFPWVYTLVGDEARSKLADLSVELRKKKSETPLTETQIKAARDNILNPSHVISLGMKRGEEKRMHEDYATLGASVQITSLALWQNGIASKWSTGAYSTHHQAYEILRLNPDEVKLEGCLFIGRAQFMPSASQRPNLEDILRRV